MFIHVIVHPMSFLICQKLSCPPTKKKLGLSLLSIESLQSGHWNGRNGIEIKITEVVWV